MIKNYLKKLSSARFYYFVSVPHPWALLTNETFQKAFMHEMSIALSIVEAADLKAREEGASTISGIELVIGKLAGIEPDSLRFCFSLAAKGTLAEEALLSIEEPEGTGECMECGVNFPVAFYYAECPECRSLRIRIVSGEEFVIQSITIEEGEK